jgi:hypothetical protein
LRAFSKSCATFLPSRGSLVAQVLCIEVLHAHVMEEEVSVKTLFAATGFSVSGCRAQFAWLVENGFLVTAQAENDKLARERDEIIRKEQMAAMFLKKENETFWGTKGDTIVATSDKFFVPPQVLQIIDDLDNQLIGLKPVKEKMKRYANQMLIHKIRSYVFTLSLYLSRSL